MHKPETTEDLRVRRTRKMLQQVFFECTIEKGDEEAKHVSTTISYLIDF